MKRILLILTIVTSFTVLANNGEKVNNSTKPISKAPVTNSTEFPNPILKLWKFFIRDYNKYTNKNFKKNQADTTIYIKKRYLLK